MRSPTQAGVEAEVEATARRHPAKIALVEGERRVSYAALVAGVDALACRLLETGLRPADRVVMQLPNAIEFVLAFLAVTGKWDVETSVLGEVTGDGRILVNGYPLRFWHFTKLGPTGDVMTKRYAGDNYPVYEVWRWYKDQVSAATDPRIPARYWAYDQYADGTPITLSFSDKIGEIMKHIPTDGVVRAEYKFYM